MVCATHVSKCFNRNFASSVNIQITLSIKHAPSCQPFTHSSTYLLTNLITKKKTHRDTRIYVVHFQEGSYVNGNCVYIISWGRGKHSYAMHSAVALDLSRKLHAHSWETYSWIYLFLCNAYSMIIPFSLHPVPMDCYNAAQSWLLVTMSDNKQKNQWLNQALNCQQWSNF